MIGGVVWQNLAEDRCESEVEAKVVNPNELVMLPAQEKERLRIPEELIPTRRYYETQKCLTN